jgi:hypothetical protein
MRYRLLGHSGLRVAELFLGAMTFGEQGGVGAPPAECRKILDTYAEAGGNVVDTAINYRAGESETILGELLAGRRDEFVLATKYTASRNPADPNAAGNHRKNLVLSLETSLRRLRTDYIDLYWVHIWDRHTPIEETMRALDDVTRAGKVLYVGISDAPAWLVSRANTLAEWRGWNPIPAGALQPAQPGHRTGAASDGRGVRDDRGGLGSTRRRCALRQVHPTRHTPGRQPDVGAVVDGEGSGSGHCGPGDRRRTWSDRLAGGYRLD